MPNRINIAKEKKSSCVGAAAVVWKFLGTSFSTFLLRENVLVKSDSRGRIQTEASQTDLGKQGGSMYHVFNLLSSNIFPYHANCADTTAFFLTKTPLLEKA